MLASDVVMLARGVDALACGDAVLAFIGSSSLADTPTSEANTAPWYANTAAKDENSVLFTRKQQPRFEALRAEIEGAILAASTARQPAPAPNGSLAEQLAQLARPHSSGSLSDQEFDAAKARLLR